MDHKIYIYTFLVKEMNGDVAFTRTKHVLIESI